MRQCNIGRLEEVALGVSDLDSPSYGHHLSAAEVCDIVSCPDRAEGVRAVLEWVLGPTPDGHGFEWEEGEWLRVGGDWDRDGVKVKVSFGCVGPVARLWCGYARYGMAMVWSSYR